MAERIERFPDAPAATSKNLDEHNRRSQVARARRARRARELRAEFPHVSLDRLAADIGVHRTTVGRYLSEEIAAESGENQGN